MSVDSILREKQLQNAKYSKRLVWILAISCGATVANLYYNQPLLAEMAGSFHVPFSRIGLVATLTQIGYALGMFLFVPLGDTKERKTMILWLLMAVSAALVLTGAAQSLVWLEVVSLLVGITTVIPQIVVPLAAQLAPPEERGKVVGTVMSGLLIGVLLARTFSGFIGGALGWRWVYFMAAAITLVLAIVLWRVLPHQPPESKIPYRKLMASLWNLLLTQAGLRQASLIGAMLFGAFSAFWTTLVFLLETPPFHFGSQVAGLFGLVGVAGAAAAPIVGRTADRRSPRFTVGFAIYTTLFAFVILWAFGHSLVGLIAGVILLDLGTQAGQISNQAKIYSMMPQARNRLNTVYMVSYFLGGSLGSFAGASGWALHQWMGVMIFALLMIVVAFAAYYFLDRASWRPKQRT